MIPGITETTVVYPAGYLDLIIKGGLRLSFCI